MNDLHTINNIHKAFRNPSQSAISCLVILTFKVSRSASFPYLVVTLNKHTSTCIYLWNSVSNNLLHKLKDNRKWLIFCVKTCGWLLINTTNIDHFKNHSGLSLLFTFVFSEVYISPDWVRIFAWNFNLVR